MSLVEAGKSWELSLQGKSLLAQAEAKILEKGAHSAQLLKSQSRLDCRRRSPVFERGWQGEGLSLVEFLELLSNARPLQLSFGTFMDTTSPKDGPGRILASMAHLADGKSLSSLRVTRPSARVSRGKTVQAAEAAKEAQATLKGNKVRT